MPKDKNVIIEVKVNLLVAGCSHRFILAMYEIIACQYKDVTNIKDFCKIMEMEQKKVSYIKASKRDVNLVEVCNLCYYFPVNPRWLVTGEGERFLK